MVAKEPEDERPGQPAGEVPGREHDIDPEDRKPLYRDEAPVGPGTSHTAPTVVGGIPDEAELPTRVGAGSTPDQSPDPATQILPRTVRGGYRDVRSDFDDDEPDEPGRLGRRSRLVLLVAGVAAVAILGLAVGYAVLHLDKTPLATPVGPASGTTGAPPASGSPSPASQALLSDAMMLSAAQAKVLGPQRTWKVARTQRGLDDQSPQPACLSPDPSTDGPPAQETVQRLLSSSGKQAAGVLHQAAAYATPEEAQHAFALSAKALGSCALPGAFISSGSVVSGLGDQAVGQVVNTATRNKTELRSVVLNRTGRVLNVLDVAQPDRAVAVSEVARALASVTNRECKRAAGACATGTRVTAGPPPPGGDQPGFLAAADLPPVGSPDATWAGTVPGLPDADFTGSGCETVDWATVPAQKRTARTYTLQGKSPIFGLDVIVITRPNVASAQALVRTVTADLGSCATRKLTATVSAQQAVRGTGSGNAAIAGWTATVNQQTTQGSARYRVGIVSAGTRTVFSFLNPQPRLDLTDAQWQTVVVRTGERATQAR